MRQIAEVMNNMEHIGASMLLLTAVIKLLLTAHAGRNSRELMISANMKAEAYLTKWTTLSQSLMKRV